MVGGWKGLKKEKKIREREKDRTTRTPSKPGGKGVERKRGMSVDGDGDEEIVGMGMVMGWIGEVWGCVRVYICGSTEGRRRLLAGATLSLLWHRSTTHYDFLPRFQRDL